MFYTTLVKNPYNARGAFENICIFHSPTYDNYYILFTWKKRNSYYRLSVRDCCLLKNALQYYYRGNLSIPDFTITY